MKLRNEIFRIHEINSRLPGVLRNWVALPLDEIKQMATDELGIEDIFNFVLKLIVDYDRRQKRLNMTGVV